MPNIFSAPALPTQTEANNLDRNAVATGVASFLEDALNSKSANKHLRRANMLVMGKQVLQRSPSNKHDEHVCFLGHVFQNASLVAHCPFMSAHRQGHPWGRFYFPPGMILRDTTHTFRGEISDRPKRHKAHAGLRQPRCVFLVVFRAAKRWTKSSSSGVTSKVQQETISPLMPVCNTLRVYYLGRPHPRCYVFQGKRAGFGLVMDDVLSGADIDIYGLADATRRRANGLRKASNADGSVLSRNDLASAVRARPDLKVSEGTASRRPMSRGRGAVCVWRGYLL